MERDERMRTIRWRRLATIVVTVGFAAAAIALGSRLEQRRLSTVADTRARVLSEAAEYCPLPKQAFDVQCRDTTLFPMGEEWAVSFRLPADRPAETWLRELAATCTVKMVRESARSYTYQSGDIHFSLSAPAESDGYFEQAGGF
jgi:hypothetical protein